MHFSYKGRLSDSLTTLRHAKFMEMVTSQSELKPASLPPTERSAFFHALRVHLQVAQWKHLDLECLSPEEWGWKENSQGTYEPVKTDLPPAPDCLLKYIRCKCKSENSCGNLKCSCRKNGLFCVAACTHCRGDACQNSDKDGNLLEELEEEL